MSILVKEKLMERLRKIERRFLVEFMVVPGVVRVSGRRDSVEDAVDEYRLLQENLYFEPLDKYGKEIMDSEYYSSLLSSNHIHIILILRNYYYWF